MILRELRPRQTTLPPAKQCDHPVPIEPHWNPRYIRSRIDRLTRIGWDPDKCAKGATIQITQTSAPDDPTPPSTLHLCRQHAGPIAIAELVRLSRATHIPNPADPPADHSNLAP